MSTGTAVQKLDRTTGEVMEVQTFDFHGYLSHLSGTKSLQEQQQLAAAYDAACKALIGPNDVQKESGREFKKKSAWRKLARHFGISTTVVSTTREYIVVPATEQMADTNVFVANVVVRAQGPWGQSAEAVGACATDEETGRRTITIADAIATAETRATNRAVSNLIAMGEVSAEEMSKGTTTRQATPSVVKPSTEVPFGKHKGKTVEAAGLDYWEFLFGKLEAKDNGNSAQFIRAAVKALTEPVEESLSDRPAALDGTADDLPWDDDEGNR